jgi:hypothetical protein
VHSPLFGVRFQAFKNAFKSKVLQQVHILFLKGSVFRTPDPLSDSVGLGIE